MPHGQNGQFALIVANRKHAPRVFSELERQISKIAALLRAEGEAAESILSEHSSKDDFWFPARSLLFK